MVQRFLRSYATRRDVPTMPKKEEYVSGMGHLVPSAVTKNVPTMLLEMVYA